MGRKMVKAPLLYIQQPKIQSPEATMQTHYRTPEKRNDQAGKTKKHPFSRNYFEHKQDIHGATEQNSTDTQANTEDDPQIDEPERKQQQNKRFKNMDLKERIDYFLQTPDHVPVMRAEVKTDERSYRGKIVDYQNDTVYMRVGRRTQLTEIPFETITEIQLLGF